MQPTDAADQQLNPEDKAARNLYLSNAGWAGLQIQADSMGLGVSAMIDKLGWAFLLKAARSKDLEQPK